MHASRADQAKVALALLREFGEQNWTNYNERLRAAIGRGEVIPQGRAHVPGFGAPPPGAAPAVASMGAIAMNPNTVIHVYGSGNAADTGRYVYNAQARQYARLLRDFETVIS